MSTENNDRVNTAAEQAVIACILKGVDFDPTALSDEDFGTTAYRKLFHIFSELKRSRVPIDISTTTAAAADKYGEREADKIMAPILRVLNDTIKSDHTLKTSIETLKRTTRKRKQADAIRNAIICIDGCPDINVDAIVNGMRQTLREIDEDKKATSVLLSDAVQSRYMSLEKGIQPSFSYTLPSLDKVTGGFQNGELVIIGARPSVGKSTIGFQIAVDAAAKGKKVLILSREMTAEQMAERFIQRNVSGEIAFTDFRRRNPLPTEWDQLGESLIVSSQYHIRISTTKYVEDIAVEIDQLKEREGLDLIVADYCAIFDTRHKTTNEVQRLEAITRAFKEMTIDYKIPVVLLAQLSRSSDNDIPSLASLRGSGSLEQDADVVLLLHQLEPVDQLTASERQRFTPERLLQFQNFVANPNNRKWVMFQLEKNRQGESGITLHTILYGAAFRFIEVVDR